MRPLYRCSLEGKKLLLFDLPIFICGIIGCIVCFIVLMRNFFFFSKQTTTTGVPQETVLGPYYGMFLYMT